MLLVSHHANSALLHIRRFIDIVKNGFQINQFINDAKILFEVLNGEEFLTLTSEDRYNLTHVPISDINIISSSHMYAYIRYFSWLDTWLMLFIAHLNAGVFKWSPIFMNVQSAKKIVCGLVKVKLNIIIDGASSQGGTFTTGNVVKFCNRDCF